MNESSPSPDVGGLRFRKLRIAWSVFFGVLALLLTALWVRSYWRSDSFGLYGAPSSKTLVSQNGGIDASILQELGHPRWDYHSQPVVDPTDVNRHLFIDFYDDRKQHMLLLGFPHWVGIAGLVVCAAMPWVPRRFGLRTLLIATTLIALLLGLMVHVNRID